MRKILTPAIATVGLGLAALVGAAPACADVSSFLNDVNARTTRDALFLGRYASYWVMQHDLTHLSDFYRKMGASEKVAESGGGT